MAKMDWMQNCLCSQPKQSQGLDRHNLHKYKAVRKRHYKSSLQLHKEYHGPSYADLTAHIAIICTRYMVLAVSKRDNEDERTLGELFYLMIIEIADITYHESMQSTVEAILATIQEEFHITDEQVNTFYEN